MTDPASSIVPGDPRAAATSRDGTSQTGRILRELDPDYAQVDDRTTGDLLAFARAYARELRYFPADDPDRPQGDWSGFIGSASDLQTAADYAREPEKFSADRAALYARPHFALLLAFLELLGGVRGEINAFTRRHLEFFYRDVLKMFRKRAVPDRVHVLIDLESGTSELQLPAGTALHAGKDSLGRDLAYRTDRALVANRVEVDRISSLRAEIRITGIQEACGPHLVGGNRKNAFVAMLGIALGRPDPGDPLPVPIYPGLPQATQPAPEITFDALVQARKLIGIVETGLGMPLFDDLRTLMRLKQARRDNDVGDWKQINAYLAKTGRALTQDPAAFEANVQAALNKTPSEFDHLFDGLQEVKSLDQAYAALVDRPEDVQDFLARALAPLALADFKALMRVKTFMNWQWSEIDRLLEQAAKRKNPGFTLPDTARASRDFEVKFAATGLALSGPDYTFTGGLDAYFEAFRSVERYFHMSAENFAYIMSIAMLPADPAAAEWDWDRVYDIVAAAHREKIYQDRRDALRAIAQPDPKVAIGDSSKALGDMLEVVLGEKLQIADALKKLGALGVNDEDRTYLEAIAAKSEPAPDWERVTKALEIAQRNRENFKDPVAEMVEWRNLYPAADARSVLARSAQPDAEALPRWKTFGRGEEIRAKDPVPPATLGWALGSPLLALSEGKRTIDLTLGFSGDPGNFDLKEITALLDPAPNAPLAAGFNPFQVLLSTAKGWLEPESVQLTWANPQMDYPKVQGTDTSGLRALALRITLPEDQPALAPLSKEVHGIDAPAPILRLMLKPVWDGQSQSYAVASYRRLRNLLLVRVRVAVSVAGVSGLRIRNDQTVLDAKKPFEPFGTVPATGSRFYLGHPEIVGKKLDSMTFRVTWMGAPSNLADQYRNYPPGNLGNASFKARVSLADGRVLRDFSGPLSLFDPNNATAPVTAALTPPANQGSPDSAVTVSADVTEWNRYLVWELNAPDFQHSVYSMVALQKSLELSAAVTNAANSKADPKPTVAAATYQVNPPYTPKIKSLSLDYAASAELTLEATAAGLTAMRVFHVHPFGYAELEPEGVQPGCPFLPQYGFEGELYIGLRNVEAPQNVSLLLKMAEGSADPDLTPDPVQWSYLSGNRWLTLQDGGLLADGTRGLINSGIVELSLKPAQPSTLLLGDLYWIRAAVARSADGVCDMVEIHPNAVSATFADDNNAPEHLAEPLPSAHITAPVTPIPGIARIRQPYTSFGGKIAEGDASFYVRVSERLRHKERALTAWDYERLVLEKFPDLYKVKCLPANPAAHPRDPGLIELVVIPDIRNRLPFNPFEPKAPADLIRDVEAFLLDKTPAFAKVKVNNAYYVPVKVRCGVRFLPGQDEGLYRKRLNEELNRFLSPWAYEDGADVIIGGSIYANSIINFIDRRDYVDYVAEFKLFTSDDRGRTFRPVPEEDDYRASTQRTDGVLVAAREHEFDLISEASYRIEQFTGIDYMRIELDFVVA